jgi:pimeloyl-ACP methyl ester carboxylesterase
MRRTRRRSGRFHSDNGVVATTPHVSRALYNLAVDERRAEIGGIDIFWREAPSADGGAPVVYVHGVPTSSDDWLPFLERTGGLALDLPGFGRSGKPSDFPYSIEGYAGFLDAWLSEAGVDRYRLVVHDWGAVGLGLAELAPQRVERLVIINAVPLLPGYRWHATARAWRTPLIGELVMGLTFKRNMRRALRAGTPGPDLPDDFFDSIWSHFDHGTQRAILKLYRSAPPDVLAAAGKRLGELTAPALVVWGTPDPYIPTEFAQRYADVLARKGTDPLLAHRPGGPVRVEEIAGARHWPWVGRPETVDLIVDFLLEKR